MTVYRSDSGEALLSLVPAPLVSTPSAGLTLPNWARERGVS